MPPLDSDPSITKTIDSKGVSSQAENKQPTEVVKSQLEEWALTLLAPLLVIVRVTIIFACALLADTFTLKVINWSFGSTVSSNDFVMKLLVGIQLLSALGIAIAYIIYLFRSLIKDTAEILKETREIIEDFRVKSN